MELKKILDKRRSTRKFSDRKVEKQKLYRGEGPVIYVESTEFAVKPEQEVATFY